MNYSILKKAGFSLIEILIALLLSSVMMTALFQSIGGLTRSWRYIMKTCKQTKEDAAVWQLLQSDGLSLVAPGLVYAALKTDEEKKQYQDLTKVVIQGTEKKFNQATWLTSNHRTANGYSGVLARVAYAMSEDGTLLLRGIYTAQTTAEKAIEQIKKGVNAVAILRNKRPVLASIQEASSEAVEKVYEWPTTKEGDAKKEAAVNELPVPHALQWTIYEVESASEDETPIWEITIPLVQGPSSTNKAVKNTISGDQKQSAAAAGSNKQFGSAMTTNSFPAGSKKFNVFSSVSPKIGRR